MVNLNKFKKGQALPLNTIVIAILVIIVLLVIIVFFTSKIGDSGKKLDGATEGFNSCDITANPALSTYKDQSKITTQVNDACKTGSTKIYATKCCISSN